MDETAWAAAKNPHHLMRLSRIRPSGRKYLLLACALVRRLHVGGPTPLGLRVLDAAEQFAVAQPRKGIKTHIWNEVIRPAVPELPDPFPPYDTTGCGQWLPVFASRLWALSAMNYADVNALLAVLMTRVEQRARDGTLNRLGRLFTRSARAEDAHAESIAESIAAATARVCDTIREVFADPLRPPVFAPEWLLCNHGAARHIAEGIQASGNFAELPILADALEDAGCRDAALLAHCREGKQHAPGCWALDLVLGKG